MYQYNVQGITVTDLAVSLHGVWDLGATKRFQIVRVPIELFQADSVLEALHQSKASKATEAQERWEQFLLWG